MTWFGQGRCAERNRLCAAPFGLTHLGSLPPLT